MTDGAEWVCVAEMSIRSDGIPVAAEAWFLISSHTSRGTMQESTTAIAMTSSPRRNTTARAWSGPVA